MEIPIEIYQLILEKTRYILDQINIKICTLRFNKYLNVTTLEDNKKVNDAIVLKYPRIKHLNFYYNKKITDINHLKSLRKLKCNTNFNIDDGLKNLRELDCRFNNNPINLNNFIFLRKLNCGGDVLIDHIPNLPHLEKLNCWGNNFLTQINNLTNLRKLNCGGISLINDISNLTHLEKLNLL